ncbi:MAG: CDP-6-deoxy-delta-3,4-glucoseen reductase [Methylophilaceae bacterium]
MAKVTIQSSGQTFDVRPSQTVLEAATEAGINIPYGCRNGVCGSCKGKVISGKVMHDDYQGSAMTDEELAAGHALFCCARPLEDLVIDSREAIGISGIKPRILPARVSKKEMLTQDVVRLHLQLPGSERLQFYPGQYVEFLLKSGKRRAFSIASAPHEAFGIELHLRLVKGGEFTEYVFNELEEKAILRLEAPLGSFYLREDSEKPIIFVATGTGFAPIKSIIEHMFHTENTRQILLYRGTRTLDDMYMHDLCKRWAEHMPNLTYIPVLSQPKAKDNWTGRIGYVQDAVIEDIKDLTAYQVYACGLPNMVDAARKAFVGQGLNPDEFFSDAFTFAAR